MTVISAFYDTMLFTFVVSSGPKGYTTRHHASGWESARDALLASAAFREFAEAAMPGLGAPLSERDVVLFAPLDPLVNSWVLQGGRAGEYFTVVVVGTSRSRVRTNA